MDGKELDGKELDGWLMRVCWYFHYLLIFWVKLSGWNQASFLNCPREMVWIVNSLGWRWELVHTFKHTPAMNTHIHTHTCMHACMHTYMRTCMHTHMQAHTHGCTHAHTHTHTHTCTHTHTHTHTHTLYSQLHSSLNLKLMYSAIMYSILWLTHFGDTAESPWWQLLAAEMYLFLLYYSFDFHLTILSKDTECSLKRIPRETPCFCILAQL